MSGRSKGLGGPYVNELLCWVVNHIDILDPTILIKACKAICLESNSALNQFNFAFVKKDLKVNKTRSHFLLLKRWQNYYFLHKISSVDFDSTKISAV